MYGSGGITIQVGNAIVCGLETIIHGPPSHRFERETSKTANLSVILDQLADAVFVLLYCSLLGQRQKHTGLVGNNSHTLMKYSTRIETTVMRRISSSPED